MFDFTRPSSDWSRLELEEFLDAARDESDVLVVDRPTRSLQHPTMKPIALIAPCIRNSSNADDVVLDPFAGSGSTLIAAHDLGRIAYLVEIDPRYCDVILSRWETFTGQTAERAA